jgi:hypothetical protein
MKPHKHAKLIKAWADGAEIEARFLDADGWTNWRLQEGGFIWYQTNAEYRIKPVDRVAFLQVHMEKTNFFAMESGGNLKLIFDGVSGELKNAEVIK